MTTNPPYRVIILLMLLHSVSGQNYFVDQYDVKIADDLGSFDNIVSTSLEGGGAVAMFRKSDGTSIMGQLFDASGSPFGSNFEIAAAESEGSLNFNKRNTETLIGLYHGGFVAAWYDDVDHYYYREFDASGTPLHNPIILEGDMGAELTELADFALIPLSDKYIIMWLDNTFDLWHRFSDDPTTHGPVECFVLASCRWGNSNHGYLLVITTGIDVVVANYDETGSQLETTIVPVTGEFAGIRIRPMLDSGNKAVVQYEEESGTKAHIIDFENDVVQSLALPQKDEGASWEDFIPINPVGYHTMFVSVDYGNPRILIAASDGSLSEDAEMAQLSEVEGRNTLSVIKLGNTDGWMIFYIEDVDPSYLIKTFPDTAVIEQKFMNGPESASLSNGGSVTVVSMIESGETFQTYFSVFDSAGSLTVGPSPVMEDPPATSHIAVRVSGFPTQGGFVVGFSEGTSIFIRFFDDSGAPKTTAATAVVTDANLDTANFDIDATPEGTVLIAYQNDVDVLYLQIDDSFSTIDSKTVRAQSESAYPRIAYHPVKGIHVLTTNSLGLLIVSLIEEPILESVLGGTIGARSARFCFFQDGSYIVGYDISGDAYYHYEGTNANVIGNDDVGYTQVFLDVKPITGNTVVILFTNNFECLGDALCDADHSGFQYRKLTNDFGTLRPQTVPTWQKGHTIGAQQRGSIAPYGGSGFMIAYTSTDTESLSTLYLLNSDDMKAIDVTYESDEFQVNSFENFRQSRPSSCLRSDGGTIVVWSSNRQDGSGWGIFGQMYSSGGSKVGSEFVINTITAGDQQYPTVACTYIGFIVAYQSRVHSGVDVYVRRFDTDGNPTTTDEKVNDESSSEDMFPVVGSHGWMDTQQHVVVWQSFSDSVTSVIKSIWFDGEVESYGTVTEVNEPATPTTTTMRYPFICMHGEGEFLVTWQLLTGGSSRYDIMGKLFDDMGDPQGSQFIVNSYTENTQSRPHCVYTTSDVIVVAWEGITPTYHTDVYGQLLTTAGDFLGSEFQVNGDREGNQKINSLATLEWGGLVIAWSSNGNIFYRVFDDAGNAKTIEKLANTYTDTDQNNACVCPFGNDGFMIAWESRLQDGTHQSIYAVTHKFAEMTIRSIAETTTGNQLLPRAEYRDSGGAFFIYGSEGASDDFYIRYIDSDGWWSSSTQFAADVEIHDSVPLTGGGFAYVFIDYSSSIKLVLFSNNAEDDMVEEWSLGAGLSSFFDHVSITQGVSGDLYFAYQQSYAIFIEKTSFAESLIAAFEISDNTAIYKDPSIHAMSTGDILVVWESNSGNQMQIYDSDLVLLTDHSFGVRRAQSGHV